MAVLIEKAWGHEEILVETPKYVIKRLVIKAGKRTSLQYHKIKEETMMLQVGVAMLQIGDRAISMRPFETYHLAPGTVHRLTAATDVEVLEVSTPELEDVVRLEDDYGRVDAELRVRMS